MSVGVAPFDDRGCGQGTWSSGASQSKGRGRRRKATIRMRTRRCVATEAGRDSEFGGGRGQRCEGGAQLLPRGGGRVKAAEELPWPDSRVFSAPDRPEPAGFATDSVIWSVQILPRRTAGAAPRAESGHSFALGPCDGQRCEPVSRAGPFSRKPGSPVAARKGRCRGCREWYGAVHGPDGPIPGGEGSPKSPRGWSPAGRRAAPCARTSGGRGRRGCGTNVRPRASPPPPGPAGRPRSGRHGAHRAADGER